MIRHIVLIRHRPGLPAGEVAAIEAMFQALHARLDGFLAYHGGPDINFEGLERGYRHGYVLISPIRPRACATTTTLSTSSWARDWWPPPTAGWTDCWWSTSRWRTAELRGRAQVAAQRARGQPVADPLDPA